MFRASASLERRTLALLATLGLALEQAKVYMEELTTRLEEMKEPYLAELTARLEAGTDPALPGHALEYWNDAGINVHSFNISAASLGNHEVILPSGTDPLGTGPATFDGSFSPEWSQAGVCDYLRDAILPFGLGMQALLKVEMGGTRYLSPMSDDIPIGQASGCEAGSGGGNLLVSLFAALLLALFARRWARPAPALLAAIVALGACDAAPTDTRVESALPAVTSVPQYTAEIDSTRSISAEPWAGIPVGPEGIPPGMRAATDNALVQALGVSTWHGVQAVWDDGVLTSRGFEHHFDAEANTWVEVRNPYGPSRYRRFRAFEAGDDATRVHSAIIQVNDWPFDPDYGLEEDWAFEIVPGNPRHLVIVGDEYRQEFIEGPWPEPDEGLTAVMRAFPSGPVEDAFCISGLNDIDYDVIWDFARGLSDTPAFATDTVAPAHLMSWVDPSADNNFAITNVNGFELLGGTELSNQYNFTVRYTGVIEHPGGELAFRESDDEVEDAVWVFLGGDVGSNDPNDLFLEVHHFIWPDHTPDEPYISLPAGDVPVEIIMVRCAEEMVEAKVEMSLGGGPWKKVGLQPTSPEINEDLFPAAMDY